MIIFILWLPISKYFFRDLNLLLAGEGFQRIPLKIGWIGNLVYFFFAFSLGKTISPFNYPAVTIAVIVYFLILVNFLRGLFSKRIPRESAIFILLFLLGTTILCALSNHNSPRYIMASSVFYAIILSLGILNAPKRARLILVIIISILSFYSLYNLYNERQYHKMEFIDHWDKIAAYVNVESGPNDIIIYNWIAFAYYLNMINHQNNALALPETENDTRNLIAENLERQNISKIIFVDSPLSGLKIKDYRDEIDLLNMWLKKNNFKLISIKHFDRDTEAEKKKKYINRLLPEYRTTVYIYSKY